MAWPAWKYNYKWTLAQVGPGANGVNAAYLKRCAEATRRLLLTRLFAVDGSMASSSSSSSSAAAAATAAAPDAKSRGKKKPAAPPKLSRWLPDVARERAVAAVLAPDKDESEAALFIRALVETKQDFEGRRIVFVDVGTVRLGRRQIMFSHWQPSADGGSAVPIGHDQITICYISLEAAYQKKGVLRAFVLFILSVYGAVRLEAVMNPMLIKRLKASPLWRPVGESAAGGHLGVDWMRILTPGEKPKGVFC